MLMQLVIKLEPSYPWRIENRTIGVIVSDPLDMNLMWHIRFHDLLIILISILLVSR